jgi:hypothetical protein
MGNDTVSYPSNKNDSGSGSLLTLCLTLMMFLTLWPLLLSSSAILWVETEVKYIGLHLDQKLTRKTHIRKKKKRQQLTLKSRQMSWFIGKRSQLSLENKVLIYKAILKPIWTYGIQLWGCAKTIQHKNTVHFNRKPYDVWREHHGTCQITPSTMTSTYLT